MTPRFELFALSLLLASPSGLHLAFVHDTSAAGTLSPAVTSALNSLGLTAGTQAEFVSYLKQAKADATLMAAFMTIGGSFTAMYGGAPPHPIDPESVAVVAALQALDAAAVA